MSRSGSNTTTAAAVSPSAAVDPLLVRAGDDVGVRDDAAVGAPRTRCPGSGSPGSSPVPAPPPCCPRAARVAAVRRCPAAARPGRAGWGGRPTNTSGNPSNARTRCSSPTSDGGGGSVGVQGAHDPRVADAAREPGERARSPGSARGTRSPAAARPPRAPIRPTASTRPIDVVVAVLVSRAADRPTGEVADRAAPISTVPMHSATAPLGLVASVATPRRQQRRPTTTPTTRPTRPITCSVAPRRYPDSRESTRSARASRRATHERYRPTTRSRPERRPGEEVRRSAAAASRVN